MSTALFSHIARQLPPLVNELFLHLMGEPLRHPELAAMVDICAEHHLPVNIVTNGVLLDEARCAILLKPIVRQVNISVHAFAANDTHSECEDYMQQILRFIRRVGRERPDMYINLRLWDITEQMTMTATDEAIRRSLAAEFQRDLTSISVDPRRKKQVALAPRTFLHFDSRFVWPSLALTQRSTAGYCHALSSHFGVLADGTVVPCCLDAQGILPLGDSTTTPLKAILSGQRATGMAQGFAQGKLIEELCQRCQFISRFARKARKIRANSVIHVKSLP